MSLLPVWCHLGIWSTRKTAPLKILPERARRDRSSERSIWLTGRYHPGVGHCCTTPRSGGAPPEPGVQCLGTRDTSSLEQVRMDEMRSPCGPRDDDDGRKGHQGMRQREKKAAGVRGKRKERKEKEQSRAEHNSAGQRRRTGEDMSKVARAGRKPASTKKNVWGTKVGNQSPCLEFWGSRAEPQVESEPGANPSRGV